MNVKSEFIQCRADKQLVALIRTAAKQTAVKEADVMRAGLRIGVPEFVNRLCPAAVKSAVK